MDRQNLHMRSGITTYVLFCLLLLLGLAASACRIDDSIARMDGVIGKIEQSTQALQVTTESMRAADANKDGRLDRNEMLNWVGYGGLATSLAALVKVFGVQKQTNELYDVTHAPRQPRA